MGAAVRFAFQLAIGAAVLVVSPAVWAQSDPGLEGPAVPVAAPTIVGTVPATQVPTGTNVTVTGNTTPALHSNGLTGGFGNGIVVTGGGDVTLDNLSGTGLGVVTAMNGGYVELGSGSVVTAEGSGSAAGIIGATGLYARYTNTGVQSYILADDLTVTASGDKPYGIYAHNDSRITLTGLTDVTTHSNGSEGWGLVANNNGLLTAEDVIVNMGGYGGGFGEHQFGISSWNGGDIDVTGEAQVDIVGESGSILGAMRAGSTVDVNDISGTVVSTLEHAYGAYSSAAEINVTGVADLEVLAVTDGNGLLVTNGGVVNFTGSSTLTVEAGNQAVGLAAFEGGTIKLANSTVDVTGPNFAQAIYSVSTLAATVTSMTLTDVSLSSSGAGIVQRGGTLDLTFDGVTLVNENGLFLDAGAEGGAAATLTLEATDSSFAGYARTETGSTTDVTLITSSWDLTDDSNLTTLTNNASLISFATPTGDPTNPASFKTLTVEDYAGTGGIIELNSDLDTDGSPSDKLVIDGGSASGSTGLRINNYLGGGALTTGNGILVVEAINEGTTGSDAFSLDTPAYAGPYQYLLFRSSLDDSGLENWYLRSDGIRPEVSLSAAIPSLARLFNRYTLDTFHERQGERIPLAGSLEQGEQRIAWMRVIGVGGRQGGDVLGLEDDADAGLDYGLGALQAGFDLYRAWDPETGSNDTAGVFATVGGMLADVTHALPGGTIDAGSVNLTALSVGGYWEHYGAMGEYLDAVVQGTFYSIETAPLEVTGAETGGYGFAASLEGGYPFQIGDGWTIEPQAQAIVQFNHIDSFNDGFADIAFDTGWSALGRIGFRLTKDLAIEGGSDAVGWARLNLFHEVGDAQSMTFSSDDGPVAFTADLGDSWVQLAVGADYDLDANAALFGQLSYDTSFDGASSALAAKVGLKGKW
jgi:uncharacterized protein YhjY with autotransporter beta-barrel domain